MFILLIANEMLYCLVNIDDVKKNHDANKQGPVLGLSTLGCSSTLNNTLQVLLITALGPASSNAGPANRPSSVKSKGSSNGVDSCIERLVKHLTENQWPLGTGYYRYQIVSKYYTRHSLYSEDGLSSINTRVILILPRWFAQLSSDLSVFHGIKYQYIINILRHYQH